MLLITEKAPLSSLAERKLLRRHTTVVSSQLTITANRSLHHMFQVPSYRANLLERTRLMNTRSNTYSSKTNKTRSTSPISRKIIDMRLWISCPRRACPLCKTNDLKSQHLGKSEIPSKAAYMAVRIHYQLKSLRKSTLTMAMLSHRPSK